MSVVFNLLLLALVAAAALVADPDPLRVSLALCAYFVMTIVQVYVHELAHLCGAVAVRMRIHEVSVFARASSGGVRIGGTTVRLAEIAELAFARAPERLEARSALALARILTGHPTEARGLLVHVDSAEPTSQATAHAVRALAEVELGDVSQARRLLDLSGQFNRDTRLADIVRLRVEHAERAVAAAEEWPAELVPSAPDPGPPAPRS